MLEIGHTLISFEVLRRKFCCNLPLCKGSCCVYGDAGAPLTIEESGELEDHLDELRPFLTHEGILALMQQGLYVKDLDGELVTPLIRGGACAYSIVEDDITGCAIEKAYAAGAVPFNKPLSCHLYPIRIKRYEQFDAVNYDEWDICGAARREGQVRDIPVYLFAKEALIRKYGEDWFSQLEYAAQHLDFNQLISED